MIRALELASLETFVNRVTCCAALTLLRSLPSESMHCLVTSPPYFGLRSYLDADHPDKNTEIGLEDTPEAYIDRLVVLFREARRVLRADGVAWVNLGDSYACAPTGSRKETDLSARNTLAEGGKRPNKIGNGYKPKDLMMIPARVALALQGDGWWLRNEIVWHKPNPMPESVTDRCTVAHEMVYLLAKSGSTQFWTHRDHEGTRTQPEPDYRWQHVKTGEERCEPPPGWDVNPEVRKDWKRVNLWRGRDYWYDADAIREQGTFEPGTVRRAFTSPRASAMGRQPSGNEIDGIVTESGYRNRRTVWTIPTEPKPFQHFAMFPQALIEPMILAGCPATVCAACGAPYVRVVEHKASDPGQNPGYTLGTGMRNDGMRAGSWTNAERHTLGFRPSCDCGADTHPGVVLDPFMGSGTTALVAQRLGRWFIGADLNPDYCDLANRRVQYHGDDTRMVREQAAGVRQLDLFGGGEASVSPAPVEAVSQEVVR